MWLDFDADLIKIKDRLTGHPSSKLQIIPIVGMGGIGKTTLAKTLFEDALVKEYFHIHSWTTVSQEYDYRNVLLDLLGENDDGKQKDEVAECLYKRLKGRRYLIIMDDLWDDIVWDDFRRILPDDNNGSRIIITTRLSQIGAYVNSSGSSHQMQLLDKNESWKMLCNKVFAEECCPPMLVDIGKKIAEDCRGLPLAIAAIGSLLSKTTRAIEQWENVANNVSSAITTSDDPCMEILSLSYKNLPPHLKPCFLYMGIFPEDFRIRVSRLSKQWVAEGFLKTITSKSYEEVAREYVEDLIDRNLVLVDELKSDGRTRSCKLHDVLRELCMRESQGEKFIYVMKWCANICIPVTNGQRHLHINLDIREAGLRQAFFDDIFKIDGPMKSISLIGVSRSTHNSLLIWPMLLCIRMVRVLYLLVPLTYDFPLEILQLANLRFLVLSYREQLPSSISVLRHLQTLIVSSDSWPEECHLPSEIWTMTELRHLEIDKVVLPDPVDGFTLKNLETLSTVMGFSLTEEMCTRFPNLKNLKVRYNLWNRSYVDGDWQLHFPKNLAHLHKLETLTCTYNTSYVVTGINFSHTLSKLTLSGCKTPWGEMTIIGSLPNLEVLKLCYDAFFGPEWETNEGEFLRLKYLKLDHMSLKHWRVDGSTHFPCLRQLVVRCCRELEEFPSEIENILTFEFIELDHTCSMSALASVQKMLEEQRDLGNDDLQVFVLWFKLPLDTFPALILEKSFLYNFIASSMWKSSPNKIRRNKCEEQCVNTKRIHGKKKSDSSIYELKFTEYKSTNDKLRTTYVQVPIAYLWY